MDRCHYCPFPESARVICRSIQRKVKDFFAFFTCSMSGEESALPLPVLVVRGDVEGIGISTVTTTTRMRKKERYSGSGEMESHHAVEAVPAAVEPL